MPDNLPHHRRGAAFTTALTFLVVLAFLLVIRSQGSSSATRAATWDGISFGDTQQQVIGRLGEPDEMIELNTCMVLRYANRTVHLRDGTVAKMEFMGDRNDLYAMAAAGLGEPIATGGAGIDWSSGAVNARLTDDRLLVCRN